LDTDYSATGSIFYRKRDYDEYDEERYGTRFGVGRRFGTRWVGALNGRIESVNLSNIEPDEPVDVFEVQDQHIVTGLGVTLTRSTLNDPFRPWKGTRMQFGVEQVGALGGDFNFTSLTADHSVFMTVNEDFFSH